MGPHAGRIVPNGGIANKVRIEGDKLTLNPYFYVPKYRSSDALHAPEIFPLQERPRKKKFSTVYIIL